MCTPLHLPHAHSTTGCRIENRNNKKNRIYINDYKYLNFSINNKIIQHENEQMLNTTFGCGSGHPSLALFQLWFGWCILLVLLFFLYFAKSIWKRESERVAVNVVGTLMEQSEIMENRNLFLHPFSVTRIYSARAAMINICIIYGLSSITPAEWSIGIWGRWAEGCLQQIGMSIEEFPTDDKYILTFDTPCTQHRQNLIYYYRIQTRTHTRVLWSFARPISLYVRRRLFSCIGYACWEISVWIQSWCSPTYKAWWDGEQQEKFS